MLLVVNRSRGDVKEAESAVAITAVALFITGVFSARRMARLSFSRCMLLVNDPTVVMMINGIHNFAYLARSSVLGFGTILQLLGSYLSLFHRF